MLSWVASSGFWLDRLEVHDTKQTVPLPNVKNYCHSRHAEKPTTPSNLSVIEPAAAIVFHHRFQTRVGPIQQWASNHSRCGVCKDALELLQPVAEVNYVEFDAAAICVLCLESSAPLGWRNANSNKR